MLKKLYNIYLPFAAAVRTGVYSGIGEHFRYRLPSKVSWARSRGLTFHRSSLLWFRDDRECHTRITLLLPRLAREFPGITSLKMEFEFFSADGAPVRKWTLPQTGIENAFVLDSQRLPAEFDIPKPFNGTLIVKQTFPLPDETVFKKQGLFGSTHTYIDYYLEGAFVTTLHDYCAYLPDQVISEASLGMIPAYCDAEKETFFLAHAASDGIHPRDLTVRLLTADGRERSAPLPPMKPFAVRQLFISELFSDAQAFLGGRVGQIVIEGIFRRVLRRTAYGIFNKRARTFSLDHCYYSLLPQKRPPMPAAQREKMPKGWSNPFVVLENEDVSTSAILFQSARDSEEKHVDLLIYDEEGRCVVNLSPYAKLSGDKVEQIRLREILAAHKIALPFMGHAEVLYHKDPSAAFYSKDLDLYVEYDRKGKAATVIFGSDPWNPPRPAQNRTYKSACRVFCDEAHTTRLAISNCSYDYDYDLDVSFRLSLVADGRTLDSKQFSIKPNATIFKSVEDFFPNASDLLKDNGGLGLLTTTDINSACLTHLFFTEDRKSRAFSVEHSLDV